MKIKWSEGDTYEYSEEKHRVTPIELTLNSWPWSSRDPLRSQAVIYTFQVYSLQPCSKSVISFFLFSPQNPISPSLFLISAIDLVSYLTVKTEATRKELSPASIPSYPLPVSVPHTLPSHLLYQINFPCSIKSESLYLGNRVYPLSQEIPSTNLPLFSINFSFSTGSFPLNNKNAISSIVSKQHPALYPTGTASSCPIVLQQNFLKEATYSDQAFLFLPLPPSYQGYQQNPHGTSFSQLNSSFWAHLTTHQLYLT